MKMVNPFYEPTDAELEESIKCHVKKATEAETIDLRHHHLRAAADLCLILLRRISPIEMYMDVIE